MIRAATPRDARGCAELLARAWRRAYGDVIAEPDMPSIDDLRERWEHQGDAGASVLEQDGRLAGVVRIGESTEQAGVGELVVLYVEPAAQGAGVGSLLHEHAIAALRARGYAEATLWTFSANGQARDFYAARGWRPDGASAVWRGAMAIRLRREL